MLPAARFNRGINVVCVWFICVKKCHLSCRSQNCEKTVKVMEDKGEVAVKKKQKNKNIISSKCTESLHRSEFHWSVPTEMCDLGNRPRFCASEDISRQSLQRAVNHFFLCHWCAEGVSHYQTLMLIQLAAVNQQNPSVAQLETFLFFKFHCSPSKWFCKGKKYRDIS